MKLGPLQTMRFNLPEPPSANRWWRNVNGRMVTSAAARKYKAQLAKWGNAFVVQGPIAVTLDWYRGRKSGDLDKRIGVALDAMQGVFYENDAQIVSLFARRFEDPKNPRVEVTVERIPESAMGTTEPKATSKKSHFQRPLLK